MKLSILTVIALILTKTTAYANQDAVAAGTSKLFPAGNQYELVVEDDVAKRIYERLGVPVREVRSKDGGWSNKNANGIVCGQNQKTLKHSCSLAVDENGVQH